MFVGGVIIYGRVSTQGVPSASGRMATDFFGKTL